MVFKRRDRRPLWKIVTEFFWPKGGWGRAFQYTKHRLRRLPDTSQKIARGVAAGIVTIFTPLFGMHFVVAAVLATILRGNIVAALLATFLGNPVTFVPIGAVSLKLGYWFMGMHMHGDGPDHTHRSFAAMFVDAADDLQRNILAWIFGGPTDWHGLGIFYHGVFLPYLVGGAIPGILCGILAYFLSEPVIRAYQNHRRNKIRSRLAMIQKLKAEARAEAAAQLAANKTTPPEGEARG